MKNLYHAFSLALVFLMSADLPAQSKIVLTTYNATITDAMIASIAPKTNWGSEPNLWPYSWTQDGIINITRPLIRFDLLEIPPGVVVEEALLILHYDPYTHWFDKHFGQTDFLVRRITEPWEEFSVSWSNQPATTTEHEVYVPPAVFDQQNYVIDVTELMKDMLSPSSPGNYGFMLQLQHELPYTAVRLAGTDHADVSRHPQLWLTLGSGAVGTEDESMNDDSEGHFTVGPNPTAGEVFVSSKTVPKGENTAEVYDAQGKRVFSQALTGSYSDLFLNNLPVGMYVLKIFNDASGYIQEEKIVVAR